MGRVSVRYAFSSTSTFLLVVFSSLLYRIPYMCYLPYPLSTTASSFIVRDSQLILACGFSSTFIQGVQPFSKHYTAFTTSASAIASSSSSPLDVDDALDPDATPTKRVPSAPTPVSRNSTSATKLTSSSSTSSSEHTCNSKSPRSLTTSVRSATPSYLTSAEGSTDFWASNAPIRTSSSARVRPTAIVKQPESGPVRASHRAGAVEEESSTAGLVVDRGRRGRICARRRICSIRGRVFWR